MNPVVVIGALLAVAFGLAIATDRRDRRSRRRRVQDGQIDATKADTLSSVLGGSVSEYLPPPDDGHPQH